MITDCITKPGNMPSDNMGRSRPHVVAMPLPARGHLNPMMNFCKLLASRRDDVLITFVVTEEWLGFIGSDIKPDNIRFGTIPNIIPSERVRAADLSGFYEAVMTKMEDPFEQLLNRLEPPVTTIVADTFLFWAVGVGNRRNIPVASFFPMSATLFSMFHHVDLLAQNGHHPIDISERGDERVDYIPGLSSTLIADFPPLLHNHNPVLARIVQAFSCLPRAHCLLLTSVYELEAQVIDALKSIFSSPIYPIGPVIPYFKLGDSSSVTTGSDNLNYLQWLDSQPCHSVLYISFGSVLSVSSAQTDEIAAGLRDSGVRFLWVARGEASRLREVCGEMGLVVPWCDQLKVLSHSSVGGFWTHCGWNSTVEGLFSGLPFLTFPIALDQFSNSRAAVEDWKIGWRVKRQAGVETLVLREEIAELLKRFMDLESHEGKEMRRRARKVQKICEEATANGGSSETNMDAFTREITQLLLPSHEEI
ncbi:UDP-glycosyltransferase 87A1 [Vitis vinifera]|uniref:UDP-glycosyltransferase 87A1 n=1 Tax=Vitis vinifera TaxID=29760 RepID=A0A438KP95_VITVI|nr:UDP-glycosyltransferase 87A1 [Vitis vinifera]